MPGSLNKLLGLEVRKITKKQRPAAEDLDDSGAFRPHCGDTGIMSGKSVYYLYTISAFRPSDFLIHQNPCGYNSSPRGFATAQTHIHAKIVTKSPLCSE
jgi:hypothetical protein